MTGAADGAVFVIHGLVHLRAALAAGATHRCPITVLSASAATAYAGAGWFTSMIAAGRAEYPDVKLTAILDCGDRAGDALAAFDHGATNVIFCGHPDAAARLRAIATAKRITLFDRRPAALDFLKVKDPDYAAHAVCQRARLSAIENPPK